MGTVRVHGPTELLPQIIAHRGGAPRLIPEHSLAAYAIGAEQGAHYIEPDLQVSRDGMLFCMHDSKLGATTNIATRRDFASRRRTPSSTGSFPVSTESESGSGTVENDGLGDWLVEDFDASELLDLQLRPRECMETAANTSHRNCAVGSLPGAQFDFRQRPVLFREMLQLTKQLSLKLGRQIGVAPETKRAKFYRARGVQFEKALLHELHSAGFLTLKRGVYATAANSPGRVILQSMDETSLRIMRNATDSSVRIVQGMSEGDDLSPASFSAIASYAHGVALPLDVLESHDDAGKQVVSSARAHGLQLLAWTLRNDAKRHALALELELNAVFSDDVASSAAFFAAAHGLCGAACVAAGPAERLIDGLDQLAEGMHLPAPMGSAAALLLAAATTGAFVALGLLSCYRNRSARTRTVFGGHQFQFVYSQ
mmetsp:Transcript_38572/g.81041  ORF Transcript_38572/g.81041 Transcript_38572/m.81041 type:complete len:427 (-) Transcript_38572:234-1514(-)